MVKILLREIEESGEKDPSIPQGDSINTFGENEMKRFMILILAVVLNISFLAGCARDIADDDDTGNTTDAGIAVNRPDFISVDYMTPGYVYIAETIPFPDLPAGLTNINLVKLANNAVYFTAWGEADEYAAQNVHGLFSMDIDGTNFSPLPNYIPGSIQDDIQNKFVSINSLYVDVEGNLWVTELRGLGDSDGENNFPDGFGTSLIRILDKTGEQLAIFDISDLPSDDGWIYVHSLSVDSWQNIYVASQTKIHVLDHLGNFLFTLDNPEEWIANFIRMTDGTVALAVQQGQNVYLQTIDVDGASWGEIISIPGDLWWLQSVFSGIGEYLYLYNDRTHLNGVLEETGEHIQVFNWVDSNLSSNEITAVMLLPDTRVAATRQLYTSSGTHTELVLLTRITAEELDGKIVFTLATLYFDSEIRHVVEQFNRQSDTHRIDVIDYSTFNTDDDPRAGLMRLNTEIITGNGPDILDMWLLPIQSYASKGVLVDLYPYLDADPEFNRDDLVEGILKASETNDSLYRIIPSFSMQTMYGNPSVLGSYPGWTMEEFLDVIAANPQADWPLGHNGTKWGLLQFLVRFNIDEYVDRSSGTAYFESDEFVKILEIANTFPMGIDPDFGTYSAVAQGRQIIDAGGFGPMAYQVNRALFGGDLVIKGYPNEQRDGNIFSPWKNVAITTFCEEPDVAWEFVRLYLSEEVQRDIIFSMTFPINKVILEEVLTKRNFGTIGSTDGFGGELMLEMEEIRLSEEEIDNLRNIIYNATRIINDDGTIWGLVTETASDYFNGRHSAQDAARIIQNRVTIYLAEQN